MRPRLRSLLAAAALILPISACSGGNESPTGPSPGPSPGPGPAPTPTAVSLSVSGPATLTAGTSAQYQANLKYSDGSMKDVTAEATWSSSSPTVVDVRPNGMVYALKPGEPYINANLGDDWKIGYRITITPVPGTPWSNLPPISQAARELVMQNIERYGALTRWKDFPIRVYATPDFRPQDVVDAAVFWETATNGKVRFRVVDSPADANVVLDMVWPPPPPVQFNPESCGVEGPNRFDSHVVLSGFGHYAFKVKPECATPDNNHRVGLAHGLGHIIGLMAHTPSGTDVMGSPGSTWLLSALLREWVNWTYDVAPATRPE